MVKVHTDSTTEKVVYFIRHGQSQDNVSPVFQAPDSPLSTTGKEQARFMAERIKHLEFESLIASPLPRAKETADILSASTGKPADIEI